jgi:hypothetical protein
MTIFCRVCKRDFSSIKPEAQKDVLEQMSKHLVADHKKEAKLLAETITALPQLLGTYLLIKNHVEIPAGEVELLESVEENETCLMGIFGLIAEKSN